MERQGEGIVLVLGGGGARGLAHVGVLKALAEAGVPVAAVVGCSIGAQIGALYCSGVTPLELEAEARQVGWWDMLRFLWPDFGAGGFTSGGQIHAYLTARLSARSIEDFPIPFACVATDLATGAERVFDRGPAVAAVRASIALPLVLSPYRIDGHVYADGGLVNPVPVSVARHYFDGPVLAVLVHVGSQEGGAWPRPRSENSRPSPWAGFFTRNGWMGPGWSTTAEGMEEEPGLVQTLRRSVEIMQGRLVDLHLSLSPPDLTLRPKLGNILALEFHKGEAAVAAGYAAAREALTEIEGLLRPAPPL